jgi:hypothetical protein
MRNFGRLRYLLGISRYQDLTLSFQSFLDLEVWIMPSHP